VVDKLPEGKTTVRQPIFRSILLTILAAAALFGILTATSSRLSAGSVSTSVIGMFPKSTSEFAYADLKGARKLTWFGQMQDQMLPAHMRQFEQFLASAGVDPNTQVESLAWGTILAPGGESGDILGVALGGFDPSSTEARFKAQKIPMIEEQGFHLYAFGSGGGAGDILFFFLDSNTAAFGNRASLEKMIDVRMGNAESLLTNDKIFPLISEANGTGLIWAVLDKTSTTMAMHQLLPQASQFPQAATIIGRIRAMTISVNADSGLDVQFQAVCESVDDANTLGAAMQAGVMYRRYQESQSNPDFAKALDHVRITPTGDRLKIDAPVSQDELMSLLRTKALAPS
jgi:hypothetical protein